MGERSENYNYAGDADAEATLVTPRFDAEEARHATPVVPLAEARPHAPLDNTRARTRRGLRRRWPPALLAVALLAVLAVGGAVASKVLRREGPSPAAHAPAAFAPASAAEATTQAETVPTDEATREVADAKPEARPVRDARARRAQDAPPHTRPELARDDPEDSDDDKERRKRREKRRERAEDEADKEMRKVLKRAKDKAPRLVDVIIKP